MSSLNSVALSVLYAGIHLLEAMGFVVIMVSAFRAFWEYWTERTSERLHFDRLRLAEGLASGLEFKLGGEILRTVVVQNWEEIIVVGAIVVLRALMSLMIHWEIRHEKEVTQRHYHTHKTSPKPE